MPVLVNVGFIDDCKSIIPVPLGVIVIASLAPSVITIVPDVVPPLVESFKSCVLLDET